MSRTALAITFLVLAALPAAAQTTYAPPGDTLRFHDVTQGKVKITSPQGEIPISIENRSTIAVVRMAGDSARAWYDSLSVLASTPGGDMHPATDSVLHRPFRLGFDARGKVTLREAPKFPASFESISDLTHQFDDFFLRLPAKPLALGLAWTDTSSRTDSTADKTTHWSTIVNYRVERDTVVNGTPALVISMRQKLRISGDAPVPNTPMRARSLIEGTDDGMVVFAPRAGRLLARRRTGALSGDVVMTGAQGEITMQQAFNYTGATDALR